MYENLISKGLIHFLAFHESYLDFFQLIIFLIDKGVELVDFLKERVDLKIFLKKEGFHGSDFLIRDI